MPFSWCTFPFLWWSCWCCLFDQVELSTCTGYGSWWSAPFQNWSRVRSPSTCALSGHTLGAHQRWSESWVVWSSLFSCWIPDLWQQIARIWIEPAQYIGVVYLGPPETYIWAPSAYSWRGSATWAPSLWRICNTPRSSSSPYRGCGRGLHRLWPRRPSCARSWRSAEMSKESYCAQLDTTLRSQLHGASTGEAMLWSLVSADASFSWPQWLCHYAVLWGADRCS